MSHEDLMDAGPALATLERVLDRSRADETEVSLGVMREGLTRFAESRIHQNVAEENAVLRVRVVSGGRVAGVRTNRFTADSLDTIAARAVEIARQTPPDPDFPGLPLPTAEQPLLADRVAAATAAATPRIRAEAVRAFVDACAGATTAGALATWVSAVAVGNSHGVRAYGRRSRADFVADVRDSDGSAYVSAIDTDVDRLDWTALAGRAVEKARAGRAPVDLEPGTYPVILEPDAVGLMLAYLALGTFNGRAVLEGRSALSTGLGERLMAPQVQLWDDPADPRTVGLPFDAEGVPKGRLDLVHDGVAVGIAQDSRTARKAGVANTGHALPQPNAFGPVPTNLIMAPGSPSLEALIASTARGVLVSRFHYVRVVHPVRTMITGMTRAGTFLIDGGKITRALRNLRFNQSMLETFASVEAISAEGQMLGGDLGVLRYAPALKAREFTFTGGTVF